MLMLNLELKAESEQYDFLLVETQKGSFKK